MADVQILAPGVQAAPLDYTVQAGQEILLKSLFASFDGSAAASAFLPAIQILSDSGHVVGTYITQATVAAGGSADVSFGPFLRGQAAAAAAGSGSPSAVMIKTSQQTINAGALARVNLDSSTFATSDGNVFSSAANSIIIAEPGLYFAWAHEQNDNFSADPTLTQFGVRWFAHANVGPNFPSEQIVPKSFVSNAVASFNGWYYNGGNLADTLDGLSIAYCASTPTTVQAWYDNLDIASIALSTCLLAVVQLQAIDATTLAGFPSFPF